MREDMMKEELGQQKNTQQLQNSEEFNSVELLHATDIFAQELNEADHQFQERLLELNEFPGDIFRLAKEAADFNLDQVNAAKAKIKEGDYQATSESIETVISHLADSPELRADYRY